MKNIKISILLLLLIACIQPKKNIEKQASSFVTIPIEFDNNIKQGMKLSDIVENIEFVPLELTDDCLLRGVDHAEVTDEYIYVVDKPDFLSPCVYQFDRKGHFLHKIGTKGEGPEEFISTRGFTLNHETGEIFVYDGVRKRIVSYLPDGTLVWLNAGSRMTYSQGFGVDNRMIELEGEGYFEVRRNEKLPFFVKTKDLQLQVLGTKFNFRDYPEDHEVVVSLLEGKVELNNLLKKEKEAILAPDERAILNKTNGRMTVETVTASNASQWTDGYLFFDEELLPDIVKELERSYNVTIRIANDSLNTFRFYGNFVRREQSIQEVLDALASTEKIQYKIEERNITIY